MLKRRAFVLAVVLMVIVAGGLAWLQRGLVVDPAQDSAPLTVGTNVWPGYEPMYLARDLGHYGDAVRMVEYSSATEVIRALRNKLIDAGALTLDEALLLRQSGVDVRVVLVTDISDGGDVIMAKPRFERLADLKGRRIGVESTALGAYVLTRGLRTVNLTPADVQVVQMEVDGHHAAYLRNEVDAVVTFEPVRSQLLKAGARTVFDSSEIPGEIVDVLVIRADVGAVKGEQICSMIEGWFKAVAYLSEHPEDASVRMSARLNVPAEEVPALYDGLNLPNQSACVAMLDAGHERSLHRTAKALGAVMMSAKLLEGEVELTDLVAPDFLQSVCR